MTVEHIIRQLDFNYQFTLALVADVADAQMTVSPGKGLENHPAFTLGHLITGTALTNNYLGDTYNIPKHWDELFKRNGPGDPRLPNTDTTLYPDKATLLDTLKKERNKLKTKLLGIENSFLHEDVSWRFANYMPKNIDMLLFMCINHEAMHLGQLSAWRRAMGLPSALAKL